MKLLGKRGVSLLFEQLSCGLPVLIKTVPNKVVTLDAWVNTGSANEDESNNGISHFLEHMMFKGTPKYGVGELDRIIMNVGGVWNAGTSKDFTHYYVTVASPFFETALDCISDMLQNSLIDKNEFDREKQVILEEFRRKQDSPFGFLYDELYEATFQKSPYRQSVLGSFESISALDRDAMYDYYQRYYTPANMLLIIVGDVEPHLLLPMLEKAFSGFKNSNQPLQDGNHTTEFSVPATKVIEKDVNETYMAMSFPAPGILAHEEVLALDLASTILSDGRSSRMYQDLKEKQRIVHSISAGFPTHRHESMFYVISTLDADNVAQAQSATMKLLREFSEIPPGESEMAKAKRIISNGFQFGMETNTGQSGTIGYYYTLTGTLDFLDSYLERLASITPEQVSSVVRNSINREPNIVVLAPHTNTKDAAL